MRLFILLLVLFGLISCESTKEKEYRIAVFISGEGRKAKVKGFQDGLKNLGVEKVKYTYYEGDNTLGKIRELAQELVFKENEYDLIIAGGSLEAYMVKTASGKLKTPVIILGGTSILQWGLTNSLSRPSENITGVDNLNAELMEKRVELFSRMFPQIKKVLVFCNPQFEASKNATRITIRAGKKFGVKVVPLSVRDVKELEYVISNMREDGYDAIIITPCFYTENFLTTYILHYANFYQVPVFCPSPGMVKRGCHVAYGTTGYEQGFQAAHIAYKILNGVPVEHVPFERAYYPRLAVNEKALAELGVGYNKEFLSYVDEVMK
ncbi:putative ABC transport system substrate-binding protein [Hydrogenivirga caldilitoris]|uniref:Putative ABC transport system substrate-binding protein n=1 Tax=Hydrogenivirga caldilitoris TaxID=246264 RepID=A0A497XNZ2_9AQUI|nr:ABC transporter substrate binding protein [Hydrogenivirga caldilitoris]RLJ69981.1 putative ABC transport system substrate-binding protein [Hydrogenivirga caldilitoris]